jgi:DNA-binding NarL/FixJ family response regulator
LRPTPVLPTTRIVLVDDHAIVRECVRAILERQRDMSVVGLAAHGEQAVLVSERLKPDLIVMDLALPGLSGSDTTRRILALLPRTYIIVLSTSCTSEHVHGAYRAGARGYVAKDAAGSDLVCAVRTVSAGHRYLSPTIGAALNIDRPNDDMPKNLWEHLTEREREVLSRTAAGASTAVIAAQLSLSPKTVDTYRSRLMRKLGVADRSTLIRYAMQHSLSPF